MKTAPDFTSTAPRICPDYKCKGTGIVHHDAFSYTYPDGRVSNHPARDEKCRDCEGTGMQPRPDFRAIVKACIATRGKNKGTLRASAPGKGHGREYYVWRMARFHGGKDVTMPMVASICAHDDAWLPELDALADWLAIKTCGTDRAAAYRWGNALGFAPPPPLGLPETAYEGGPVVSHDATKPDFELAELLG